MNQDANDLFEKFALKQQQGLKDMYSVRGLRQISDNGWRVTCLNVAEILKQNHNGDDYYNDNDYQPRTSVLFYAYDDLKLYSWLIDETGLLG